MGTRKHESKKCMAMRDMQKVPALGSAWPAMCAMQITAPDWPGERDDPAEFS
jgi:hypothetical protein